MLAGILWFMWFVYCLIMTVTGIIDANSFTDIMVQILIFLAAGFVIPASLMRL